MSEYVRSSRRLSWHVVRNWTRVPDRAIALCGRTVFANELFLQGTGPALDEKGCEMCERIALRNAETVS